MYKKILNKKKTSKKKKLKVIELNQFILNQNKSQEIVKVLLCLVIYKYQKINKKKEMLKEKV